MAGFTLTITVDDALARRDAAAMIERMDNPRPFYAAIGNLLVASSGENFLAERAPDGTPWQPLAPATIKARRRKGRSGIAILRESGLLKGSISFEVASEGVRIGATPPYAAIHQSGGTIQAKARTGRIFRRQEPDGTIGRRFAQRKKANLVTDVQVRAHAIRIPARPYLGIGAGDIDDIRVLANRWLAGQL